ncbi:MAG: hypothetical protein FWH54_02835 [Methanobrevibacter sp.]|nr:hypothetical protein [Methanobrevibacter sp.]
MEDKRKNCKGTIKKPPPIPSRPDKIPQNIPIMIKTKIYSIEKIKPHPANVCN